jgi:hypothetical protein
MVSTSNTVSETIQPLDTPIPVAGSAGDVAWDAVRNVLYISIPHTAASHADMVAAVDPSTGAILNYLSVGTGSNPQRLSVSATAKYLYVGLNGTHSVGQVSLVSENLTTISLGLNQVNMAYYAGWLAASPGSDDTWAVSRFICCDYPNSDQGVAIYDDSTMRPDYSYGPFADSIVWGSDNTAIYAEDAQVSSYDLYTYSVNSQGATLSNDFANTFDAFSKYLHYDKTTNLLYSDSGQVVNESGVLQGAFDSTGPMVPDGANGLAFIAGTTPSESGTDIYPVQSFDIATYQPVAIIQVANLPNVPSKLIRFGEHGLAILAGGQVFLVNDSTFVAKKD